MKEFWKISKSNFLEIYVIYVIESTKKVLKKIQEPIPFIKRGYKVFFNFWIIFLMWITSWTPTIFFFIMLKFEVTIYIFSKIFGKVPHR